VTCRYVADLCRQVLGVAEGVCEKGRMTERGIQLGHVEVRHN
jgi:hypothetical protein